MDFTSLFTFADSVFVAVAPLDSLEVAGAVPETGFDTGTGIDTGAGAVPTPFARAVFLSAIFLETTTPAAVPAATAALCAPSAATF